MSGRRRRDDGWADSPRDAQDDRRDPWAAEQDDRRDSWADQDDGRDPWADSSVDEWASRDRDQAEKADWAAASGDGGAVADRGKGSAGAYVSNGAAATAYSPPAFPSFTMTTGTGKQERGQASGQQGGYDAPGYGNDRYGSPSTARRPAANGGGYQDSGYGQDAGLGRNGQSGGRRDGAGYDPAFGGDSAGAHAKPGYGSAGYGNEPGYGGAGYGPNGRSAVQAPEFTPVDNDDLDDDGPAGTPRPIGRLSIYTLHEDKTREFDHLAERAAEGVRASEPDTLVYVIHVVPKAPMQRIMYEIYRDRAAFLSHERQPHIRQFAVDRASCVLATNVIDLRLKYAKVASLGSVPEVPAVPGNWPPAAAETAVGGDRNQAAAPQYQPAATYQTPQYQRAQQPETQYQEAQYQGTQYQGTQQPGAQQPAQYPGAQYPGAQYSAAQYQADPARPAAAASFTPAKDRYPTENRQYAATGREHYPTIAQYDNSANGGGYGTSNGQYGSANGYSSTASYANGGSYASANGYPSDNDHSAGDGYQGPNGYSGGNGYQDANGYSDTNGYSNGNGYQGASGYPNGSGYSNGAGYSNGSGYQNGSSYSNGSGPANGAANGYADNTNGAANGVQYTPRYRELTSGPGAEAAPGDYPANGDRYGDGSRQSARASDWDPRPQDRR
jgi:quinol monooxygenase YgiN